MMTEDTLVDRMAAYLVNEADVVRDPYGVAAFHMTDALDREVERLMDMPEDAPKPKAKVVFQQEAEGGDYSINAQGDVVTGDEIRFVEAVFGGSFRNPKYLGTRTVWAKVLKDSYGAAKQQHTFTLEVVRSDGVQPLTAGNKTTRKGRNIYRNEVYRKEWPDEAVRDQAAAEKHTRGDVARSARDRRREREPERYY